MPEIGGSTNPTTGRLARGTGPTTGAAATSDDQPTDQQPPATPAAHSSLQLSQSARTLGRLGTSVDPGTLSKLTQIRNLTRPSNGRGLRAISLGAQGFAQAAQAQAKYDKLGYAGMAVGGIFSAGDLPGAIHSFLQDPSLASAGRIVADGANTTQAVDAGLHLARLGGFLSDKANAGLSIVGDVADMPQEVAQILDKKASTEQRVGAGLYLAGDGIDAAGSALIASGAGAPVGVVLQCVAAGVMVAGFAVENFHTIECAVEHPVRTIEDIGKDIAHGAEKIGDTLLNTGKSVLHALNPANWF